MKRYEYAGMDVSTVNRVRTSHTQIIVRLKKHRSGNDCWSAEYETAKGKFKLCNML